MATLDEPSEYRAGIFPLALLPFSNVPPRLALGMTLALGGVLAFEVVCGAEISPLMRHAVTLVWVGVPPLHSGSFCSSFVLFFGKNVGPIHGKVFNFLNKFFSSLVCKLETPSENQS